MEFEFKANPQNVNSYVVCTQDGGFEFQCKEGECFDERNPPCSKICSNTEETIEEKAKEYCSKDNTQLHRVPSDNDCNKYFLCIIQGGAPKSLSCPPNQHFSTKHEKCMSYAEAECDSYTKWCKKRKDGTKFSAKNCYEYYECRGEETLLKSCKYNEYFDANTEKCVTGICRTDDRVPNCKLQKDGKQFPHPKCYKYYMCLNKTPREIQCGTGFYYNTVYEKCVIDVNNICNDD